MATVTAALQPRRDRNGLQQLRIIIRSGKKRSFIQLPVKLKAEQWDQKNQKVLLTHQNAQVINNALRLRLGELEGKIITAEMAGTFDIDAIAGQKIKSVNFSTYTRECLRGWNGKKRNSTISAYISQLNQTLRYAPDLTLQQITSTWLNDYEQYLRKETTMHTPGILKRMQFISVIVVQAIRDNILSLNPFINYKKPPKTEGKKIWLTMEQMEAIKKYANETDSLQLRNTAWWFLFACYTGLRYGDVVLFNPKERIQSGRIILHTEKTGTIVSIKITEQIQKCLDKISELPKIYSNVKVNAFLKVVALHAGIGKSISFHTARHSFAMNCNILGIRAEATQKLLGHSSLRTTNIYYKMIDLVLDQEMEKWNKKVAG